MIKDQSCLRKHSIKLIKVNLIKKLKQNVNIIWFNIICRYGVHAVVRSLLIWVWLLLIVNVRNVCCLSVPNVMLTVDNRSRLGRRSLKDKNFHRFSKFVIINKSNKYELSILIRKLWGYEIITSLILTTNT